MKLSLLRNKKEFIPYQGELDSFKRVSFIHGVLGFLILPLFIIFLYLINLEVAYLYYIISYSLALPFYLLICWKIKYFNNHLVTFYIIHVFIVTCTFYWVNYGVVLETKNLLYFLSIFVVGAVTIQRWKWLLLYCIMSLSFLIVELYTYTSFSSSNIIIFQLFFLVAILTLMEVFVKDQYLNKNQKYNQYLRDIMNNSKTGFLLVSQKGFDVIDYNNEVLEFLSIKENTSEGIKQKLLQSLQQKDIAQLEKLSPINQNKYTVSYSKKENNLVYYFELQFKCISIGDSLFYLIRIIDNTEIAKKNILLEISEKKYKTLYKKNKSGIFTLNRSSVIIDANQAFKDIMEETLNVEDRLFGVNEHNQWDLILATFDEEETVQNYQTQITLKNNRQKTLNFSWYLDQQSDLIEGSVIDLTSIQQANQALMQSEEKFRLIYEETNDIIILVQDDKIINVNRKAIQLFGKSQEELINSTLFNLSSDVSEESFALYESYKNELNKNKGVKYNWSFKGVNKEIEAEVTVIEILLGNQMYYQYVIHDNTVYNENMRSIEKSRKSLENILENNPEGIIISAKNEVVYSNPAINNLLQNDWDLFTLFEGEDEKVFLTAMDACYKFKKRSNHQLTLKVAEGKQLVMDAMIVPTIFEEIDAVLLILKDITDQTELAQEKIRLELVEKSNEDLSREINERIKTEKLLEDQYLRTKAILDSSSNTFLVTLSLENTVTSFNKHSRDFFKETFDINLKLDTTFNSLFNSIISPAELRLLKLKFFKVKKGQSRQMEVLLRNEDREYWLEIFMNPIFDTSGNVTEISIVSHDISEKKIASIKIHESLKQKEILLKEVHHRVKNNLQVISSILSLQSSFVNDEEILNILRESQNRVRSMSDIHEHLYRSEDFSKIIFSNYLKNLSSNLVETYRTNTKVILNLDMEDVEIGLDQAIPCGLLVNEIISNALKYAWKNSEKGIFSIKLLEVKDEVILELADNGTGLPLEFSKMNMDTLGMQLIETLVEQLDASLSVDIKNGTKYLIKFVNLKG